MRSRRVSINQAQSALLPGSARSRSETATADRPHVSNQGMQRMLRAGAIQAKLAVSQPGDRFEQQADRVADAVMRRPASMGDSSMAAGETPSIQRKCTDCEEEEVQRKASPSANCGDSVFHHPSGGGQPLPESERDFFEPRFGQDFSQVRVHADARASAAAQSVNALAYTKGRDVVFGEGQYRPGTDSGRSLLAHELTHVMQQGMSSPLLNSPASLSPSSASPSTIQRQRRRACAHPGVSRTLDLQPVFLRTGPRDRRPTGRSWRRRLRSARRIWGKLGVTFNALDPITVDTPLKDTGATRAERDAVRALHTGAGVGVILVNNALESVGGGATLPGCDAGGKVVMSDGGSSNTLLAHELMHTLFNSAEHPPTIGAENTIAEGSGSRDTPNSTRNTMVNYNAIACPAGGAATCLHPDT